MKEHRIIIAGYGGQGILFMGKLLAQAAMQEGRHTTFLPAYGAEVRGGTANCMVIVSSEEIGSPYVETADSLVIMNEPSLQRFRGRVSRKGCIVLNSSLVNPGSGPAAAGTLAFPFTDIALRLGSGKAANVVALGVLVAASGVVRAETIAAIFDSVAERGNAQLAGINKKALAAGCALIDRKRL